MKACSECLSLTLIASMSNYFHSVTLVLLSYLIRSISTTIIHDNDFQFISRIVAFYDGSDCLFYCSFFVLTGNNHSDSRAMIYICKRFVLISEIAVSYT